MPKTPVFISRFAGDKLPFNVERWDRWISEFAQLDATCAFVAGITPNLNLDGLLEKVWDTEFSPTGDPAAPEPSLFHTINFDALVEKLFEALKPATRSAWLKRARENKLRMQRQLERRGDHARRAVFDTIARLRSKCGVTMRRIALAGRVRSVLAMELHACRLAEREATVHPAFAPPRAVI